MKIRLAAGLMACGVVAALMGGCNKGELSRPQVVYGNCEDQEATPCVTFDDGEWRFVVSYEPYAAEVIEKPFETTNGYILRSR